MPEGQLLVWNVKEGWAPLCEFIGVDVPPTPFPRSNDTDAFNASVKAWNRGLVVTAMVAGSVVAAGAAVLAGRTESNLDAGKQRSGGASRSGWSDMWRPRAQR